MYIYTQTQSCFDYTNLINIPETIDVSMLFTFKVLRIKMAPSYPPYAIISDSDSSRTKSAHPRNP